MFGVDAIVRNDSRIAVHRLMSSAIFALIVFSDHYDVSRFSLGHYMHDLSRSPLSEGQYDWLVMLIHTSTPILTLDSRALPQAHPRTKLRAKWLGDIN